MIPFGSPSWPGFDSLRKQLRRNSWRSWLTLDERCRRKKLEPSTELQSVFSLKLSICISICFNVVTDIPSNTSH